MGTKHNSPECDVQEDPLVLPQNFGDIAQKIEDFKVNDDDVWLVTNPKSGEE